jgi:sterol desaturase/sphingolipid hydroxylase (fatty acid hydroxylase superfamily)
MPKNYISNKDETVRMFRNDLLESLSRVHWSVPLIIYLPVIAYLFYLSGGVFGIWQISFYFILGLIVWTFTEYALHRFVFHYEPESEIGRRLHFIMHGVHHDYPNDSKRLVMPPSVSVPLALFFYFIYLYLLGNKAINPFFAGFLSGYLIYDMTHYAVHNLRIKNKFWLMIKKHHMRHHYKDATKGFGVSQKTWDVIFKTDFIDS